MLNLALVALLSGSLLTGSPDGDRDKNKSRDHAPEASAEEAPSLVMRATPAAPRAITNLTYAAGRPADVAPIKVWVSYAWGESESVWAANGETVEYAIPIADTNSDGVPDVFSSGDIVSQRAIVGAQINFLNFPGFKVGAGGELVTGSNTFQPGADSPLTNDLESGFGLQQAKAFLSLRGRALGIHGGYIFDLADDNEDGSEPNFFPRSDNRDAFWAGASFDYPSERFRLFAGLDYFHLADDSERLAGVYKRDDILWFNMGAGIRFGFVEIGAALMVETKTDVGIGSGLAPVPQTSTGGVANSRTGPSGGHAGTIAPYITLSPPALPVSLFVKGAVHNEYTDYGFGLGGGNDIKPSLGFTVGLTLGFD